MNSPVPEFAPAAFNDLGQQAVRIMTTVLMLLRGNLTMHDHMAIPMVTHTFVSVGADTEETVDISDFALEYVPSYFLPIETDDGAAVYPSDKASWTSSAIKLKSSKVGTSVTGTVF